MDREKQIRQILQMLEIGNSYRGYEYIVYGCKLVLENKERLQYITKALYVDIAAKYHTSWACVERDIRTIICAIWRNPENRMLQILCGGHVKEQPKNSRFFEMLYEYLNRVRDEALMPDPENVPEEYWPVCRDCYYSSSCRILQEQNGKMKAENQRLENMVSWMHDLIWRLLRERECDKIHKSNQKADTAKTVPATRPSTFAGADGWS